MKGKRGHHKSADHHRAPRGTKVCFQLRCGEFVTGIYVERKSKYHQLKDRRIRSADVVSMKIVRG